jgi:hypothetical protein
MKKQQNNSTRAWALHVALSVALLSISAVLLASSFKAAPVATGLTGPSASIPSLPSVDASFTFNTSHSLETPTSGIWTVTGSLNTERAYHTETLLPNGKVLVAGGLNGNNVASAEGPRRPSL